MNNKAFTLIELTAIIVVLAAIFLVSFPSLINIAKSDEEKKYENMIENLCLAGESYIYANIDDFNELSIVGNQIDINISILMQEEYVDSKSKNPRTEQSIKNNKLTYTVLSDKSLECKYIEN